MSRLFTTLPSLAIMVVTASGGLRRLLSGVVGGVRLVSGFTRLAALRSSP